MNQDIIAPNKIRDFVPLQADGSVPDQKNLLKKEKEGRKKEKKKEKKERKK